MKVYRWIYEIYDNSEEAAAFRLEELIANEGAGPVTEVDRLEVQDGTTSSSE